MRFSLIIPSYNNAHELLQELPALLSYCRNAYMEVETIIVDDGSIHSTELARRCAQEGWHYIKHEKNKGKGAAVRTGMLAATNEIRVFTDADIPFQYDVFKEILRAFENDGADIVVGDRRKSDYFQKSPLVRRMGSAVFSLAVDIIMTKRLGDTQCGLKAFRSSTVEEIFGQQQLQGFAADIEWLYRARKANYNVMSVSAEFRNAGQSSVVFWKHALLMLRDVIRLRFS
ncbi:MAG: glycosyltransferase [Flavobacteriales bacterium]